MRRLWLPICILVAINTPIILAFMATHQDDGIIAREQLAFMDGMLLSQGLLVCQFLDYLEHKSQRSTEPAQRWPDFSREHMDTLFRVRAQLTEQATDCDAMRRVLAEELTP